MTDGLARVLERQRQIRAARVGTGRAADGAAPTTPRAYTGTIPAGTRVFDTVSGEEGIVIYGARENIIVPIAGR